MFLRLFFISLLLPVILYAQNYKAIYVLNYITDPSSSETHKLNLALLSDGTKSFFGNPSLLRNT